VGYYSLLADCFACGKPFMCNPNKVPSHNNQPICEDCINIVNAKKREMGLPEWPVPKGAYEPVSEEAFDE
jgi:hypothetical protein